MADDIDAKIPPNTREMLDQTSKEGVERSRRISSLSSKIVEMEKQATLDVNKMSNEISKISKKQRVVREEMKGIKDSTIPEIEAMAPAVNKILLHISGAVGSLASGMKRITIDTANSAKNVVGQYGRAISSDISINRENLMAMSLAKATPIFGYFAAKFMQTDVFKSAAAKIKQTLGSAISSVGGGLKNISSAAASKVQNLFSRGIKEPPPKMQTGGYVEKGGVAELHPAEIIVPIDKVLSKFSEQQKGKGDVQEQTLTTLKDLSTNMKMYGSYFQKEKMNRKGLIRDFIGGLWSGKYGKSWEFRMLMATERLQEAISKTPSRFKFAWETIMWKHPIFRKLIALTKGLWNTSKMFGRMIRWPFKLLFGAKGKYIKDIKQATSTDNAMGQIANILAAIHTRMMPKLDTLIRNSGALLNFVLQESGYEKQEKGTYKIVTKMLQKVGIMKKKELSMGMKSNLLPESKRGYKELESGTSKLIPRMLQKVGIMKKKELSMAMRSNLLPGPDQMANDIKLIEENTRKTSKTIKPLPSINKDLLLEQKKTRKNIGWMHKGITGLGKKLKSSGQFIWKLVMMGFAFIQPLLTSISSSIVKYLPLILGRLGPLAGAGVAGYLFGSWYNKKIDEAFGERGGLGKWIYDKTHEYGNKWYQVAWGFANLPYEAAVGLQEKTKKTVYEAVENAYDKYTPDWIKNGVSLITIPFKKAAEFREKTEQSLKDKAKEAYDKYSPESVKSILRFITSPFKKVNKWLTEDKKSIEEKAKNIKEKQMDSTTEKITSFISSPFLKVKELINGASKSIKEKAANVVEKQVSISGKIIDFISWPFKKVSDLIFSLKFSIKQGLRSIPLIGGMFDDVTEDSWLTKAKRNEKSFVQKITSFVSMPFSKVGELVDTYKTKISEKWDNIIKDLNVKTDNIVDLITWPIRKMVELVTKAKDWTMEKLQNIPLVGRIMKWAKEEGEDTGLEPIVKPKEEKTSWWKSLKKVAGMAKGGITTAPVLAKLHAGEAVIPLPPEVAEAITKRFIDRADIAKRDVASRMADSKYAAGEFGKKTSDIASQIEKGQVQVNNAMVYTSNLMANTSSNMASTIADSMGSRGGGFSSGNDFASQVLKCNLS